MAEKKGTKKQNAARVGQRLVGRLKRFTEALEATDNITERFTCRTVRLNLEPASYNPERVKEARDTLQASQAIFAQFLGVSVGAVRDWEQGVKPPRNSACRIMDEILRDPKYWLARLKELATPVGAG